MYVLLLTTALLLLLLWRLGRFSKKDRMLDELPGPWPLPLVGNVLDIMVANEKVLAAVVERKRKYGPLFRTWFGPMRAIHIAAPQYMETVLSSPRHLHKGPLYRLLHPWLGQGLLTSHGTRWTERRKLITPTFHFAILDSFLPIYSESSEVLVQRLEERLDEDVDVYPYITRCALDIICETAMGSKINAQTDSPSPYVASISRISKLTIHRGVRLWLHSDFLFSLSAMGREYQKHLEVVHGFTERVIRERKERKERRIEEEGEEGKRRKAFLDLLLDGGGMSDRELREEVDTFMFEGHDTTAAGISWTLFLLGHHQNIQDEVFSELQDIFQDDPARAVKMGDLGQMKLLERVIKEALRLYPSVPFISRQLLEDTQIGDYLVPSGTVAVLHIYNQHHSSDVFPDPETFNPDRFLPENVLGRHPYAYVPFSAGPRNCIGQKFALHEEKVVLSTILRRFKVTSLEKPEDVVLLSELNLRPAAGIKVRLQRR